MTGDAKPKLIPLRVPWMVSPSTPFLRLVAFECDFEEKTHVEFLSYDKRLDTSPPTDGKTVEIAAPPGAFRASGNLEEGPDRLVRMAFYHCIAARMCPSHSDAEVVEESAYDWSAIPARFSPGDDIFAYLERNRALWLQTGICPNPRAYEVANSPWLKEYGLANGPVWKHYLILGHDAYVEVIAKGYEVIFAQAAAKGPTIRLP